MLKPLTHLDQLAFADLVDKCHDAAFDADFPANGSILKQMRGGRSYWYYRGYEKALDGGVGASTLKYVGPADDPEITRRVTRFGAIKSDYKVRRDLAARLRRAGLPAPSAIEGKVGQALAEAGVFRLRATLVGSIAYQTYAGLLGVKFPDAHYRTGDLDLAQDYGVSVALDDQTTSLGDILQRVDPSFAPTEHWQTPNVVAGYRNATGFKVEFLTTSRGRAEYQDRLANMPALGGVGAQPLPFLDFLIREPVRSVLLYDAGVAVSTPDPARFAVHKLIVSVRRNNPAKVGKDLSQAATIIEALAQNGREMDLGVVWSEAFGRGPSWRQALAQGALRLSELALEALKNAALLASSNETEPGFAKDRAARETLAAILTNGG